LHFGARGTGVILAVWKFAVSAFFCAGLKFEYENDALFHARKSVEDL